MLKAITNNLKLMKFLRDKVEENDVSVVLDESFYLKSGKLKKNQLVNLSIDEFYNSLSLSRTPSSVDNLLVINRGNKEVSIYVIELKRTKRRSRIFSIDIEKKFKTTIEDFMSKRFKDVFHREDTKIADVNAWCVCNRFPAKDNTLSQSEYFQSIQGTMLEELLLLRGIKFRDKKFMIQPRPSGERIS